MKTNSKILNQHLEKSEYGLPIFTDAGILKSMNVAREEEACEFAEWYLQMGKNYYGSIKSVYNCWINEGRPSIIANISSAEPARTTTKEQSIIANVSNSVCGMPNCQKEAHRLGYCEKHYKLFMKYPAY